MSNMLGDSMDGEWRDDHNDVIEPALVFVDKSHNDGTLNKLNTLRKGKNAGLRAS